MALPPDCGRPYAHLVPPDCGWVCTESEYELALNRARSVRALAIAAWNDIMRAEQLDASQSYPVTRKWRASHDAWLDRQAELPAPWSAKFWQQAFSLNLRGYIEAAILLIADGTCMLHAMTVDAEAAGYDVAAPPPTPYVDPGPLGQLGDVAKVVAGAVVIAALAVVAVKLVDQRGRR